MELGVDLQAASVLKVDDGNHCTGHLGRLWGDYHDHDHDDEVFFFYLMLVLIIIMMNMFGTGTQ